MPVSPLLAGLAVGTCLWMAAAGAGGVADGARPQPSVATAAHGSTDGSTDRSTARTFDAASARGDTIPRPARGADTLVDSIADGPARRVNTGTQRVSLPAGDIAGFRPLVAADTTGGECIAYERPDVADGAREVALVFPTSRNARRHVGIVLARDGTAMRFNDSRNTTGGTREGPVTIVTIDLQSGRGGAVNLNDHVPQSSARGTAPQILAAPNLGYPGRMMDLVRSRCAAEMAGG